MPGSNPNLAECSSESSLMMVLDLTRHLRLMSEARLFKTTGCLAPCHKVISKFVVISA